MNLIIVKDLYTTFEVVGIPNELRNEEIIISTGTLTSDNIQWEFPQRCFIIELKAKSPKHSNYYIKPSLKKSGACNSLEEDHKFECLFEVRDSRKKGDYRETRENPFTLSIRTFHKVLDTVSEYSHFEQGFLPRTKIKTQFVMDLANNCFREAIPEKRKSNRKKTPVTKRPVLDISLIEDIPSKYPMTELDNISIQMLQVHQSNPSGECEETKAQDPLEGFLLEDSLLEQVNSILNQPSIEGLLIPPVYSVTELENIPFEMLQVLQSDPNGECEEPKAQYPLEGSLWEQAKEILFEVSY